jgi:hypothetical protein
VETHNRFEAFVEDEAESECHDLPAAEAGAWTGTVTSEWKSALYCKDRNYERRRMIEELDIGFDLTPDITEFEIPEENSLIFIGYIVKAYVKRNTSHYPSWMALLEAWRCAK